MKKIFTKCILINSVLITFLLTFSVSIHSQDIKLKKRAMTETEFAKFKNFVGTYKRGKNYNQIIDGHGTGLIPLTEEQWEELHNRAIIIDRIESSLGAGEIPSNYDNSATKWFPPIGNQGSQGSCVSWASGYYTKTFQEAEEHNWDLSGCTWTNGHPATSYQNKIFSPAFIYNQVNSGVDNGSMFSSNIGLLAGIGCCTWDKMPYNQADYISWPSEDAWRQAPLYRSQTNYNYMNVTTDPSILNLEQILVSGNLAIIAVNADFFGSHLTSVDLWTLDNYNPASTNHANTIVGYDDNYGPYTESGNSNKRGAFKVANSWGVGGNWEHVADGFYYISYECMKQRIQYTYIYQNYIGYKPEIVAVFKINHNFRGENLITPGIGNPNSPDNLKALNFIRGGNFPFPSNPIVIDITEFIPYMSGNSNQFFIQDYDGGTSTTGTIQSFSVEMYDDYVSGTPTHIYISTEAPINTKQNSTICTDVFTDIIPEPYPKSDYITGITYNWTTVKTLAPGSDNWPTTWADDDNQYSVWGDGGGFGGTNNLGRVSLGVARIEGESSDYKGYNVYGGYKAEHPANINGKSRGIICIGGVLYMWVGPGSYPDELNEARLYKSTDHGATWVNNSWAFTKDDGIIMPGFLQFGKNFASARDSYSYIYAPRYINDISQIPGKIDLMRVDKTQIMNRTSYKFFKGFDLSGNPQWTSDLIERNPVYEDANGVGEGLGVSVIYNSGLNRYILLVEHGASSEGNMGVFEAPEPWGPWKTVAYESGFGAGQVQQTSFYWNISSKWLSSDGKDFVMIFTGLNDMDSWNTVEASFTTNITCDLDLYPNNYEFSSLSLNTQYYVDRTYVLTSIPDEYKGFNMIKTANDDKMKTGIDFHFNICSSADIYIAYDHSLAASTPSWISDNYTKVEGKQIIGTGYPPNDITFDIWKKTTTAMGYISFGINNGTGESSMYFVFYKIKSVTAAIKIFLQGSYNTTTHMMNANLRGLPGFPKTQPYGGAPWNYTGAETVLSIPSDIVDWVLVELRSTYNGAAIAKRAAFLKKDGTVCDIDGINPVSFSGTSSGNYYIIIKHRNHLAVMSKNSVSLPNSSAYVFTNSNTYGTNAMVSLETNVYGMWAGDVNGDTQVDADDRGITWNYRNQTGYLIQDVNLDITVDADDRGITWNNRNLVSNVPN